METIDRLKLEVRELEKKVAIAESEFNKAKKEVEEQFKTSDIKEITKLIEKFSTEQGEVEEEIIKKENEVLNMIDLIKKGIE